MGLIEYGAAEIPNGPFRVRISKYLMASMSDDWVAAYAPVEAAIVQGRAIRRSVDDQTPTCIWHVAGVDGQWE